MFSALLVFFISALEIPVITIGRCFNLPIEDGGVAFIMYSLNPFGYALVLLFWTVVGLMVGFGVDIMIRR